MKQRLRPDRCDSCLITSRRFELSKQVGGVQRFHSAKST